MDAFLWFYKINAVIMENTYFSVIVPAYNEEKLIAKTLSSLNKAIANAKFSGELIVVDNNSTDKTAQIARDYGATVVFEEKRQIAKARNAGANRAKGNFLFFTDADTVVPIDIFKKLLPILARGKVCGGGVLPEFDVAKNYLFNASLAFWKMISTSFSFAAGCFIFADKKAFNEVGGFNENLFASEEIDLSKKLKKLGRKNKQVFKIFPEIKVLTSARKSELHSLLFLTAIIFTMFPIAVRFKTFCFLWYDCGRD